MTCGVVFISFIQNVKIFKWGFSIYSMEYNYNPFPNTQEVIKTAIKSAKNKLKRQENYNKTKKEFWGK